MCLGIKELLKTGEEPGRRTLPAALTTVIDDVTPRASISRRVLMYERLCVCASENRVQTGVYRCRWAGYESSILIMTHQTCFMRHDVTHEFDKSQTWSACSHANLPQYAHSGPSSTQLISCISIYLHVRTYTIFTQCILCARVRVYLWRNLWRILWHMRISWRKASVFSHAMFSLMVYANAWFTPLFVCDWLNIFISTTIDKYSHLSQPWHNLCEYAVQHFKPQY